MRGLAIRYLITSAGSEGEAGAVGEGGGEFTVHTKKDVAFGAPVVGGVAGRVFDHADANVGKVLGAPEGDTGVSGMFGGRNLGPVGGREREPGQLHRLSMPRRERVCGWQGVAFGYGDPGCRWSANQGQ